MHPPSGRFARDRWRACFGYLRRQPGEARERLGGRLAAWLGGQRNTAHRGDERLERVRLYRVDAPIALAGDPAPDRRRTRVRELATVSLGASP